jgi:hypothetical protein
MIRFTLNTFLMSMVMMEQVQRAWVVAFEQVK